jgi:hypothetical protein
LTDISTGIDASPSVSYFKFLERIKEYKCDLAYIQAARDGLVEAQDGNNLTLAEFQAELAPFLLSTRNTREKLNILEGQRELLKEGLDEMSLAKRQRQSAGRRL